MPEKDILYSTQQWLRAGAVTIMFGVNMHGRDQVEGRVIIQVRINFFSKRRYSVDTL